MSNDIDIQTDIQPILEWLQVRRDAYQVAVTEIGVNETEGWKTDSKTGNIVHDSGKFFSIIGVNIQGAGDREVMAWSQPMLKQEEVGISGVIIQKRDGVMRYLFYAKFEPGNIDVLQISPALQASEGNLSQAHNGPRPRLSEYFDGTKGTIIHSVAGVEDGGRFYRKVIRAMVVEVEESEEVSITDDYIWLTLPEIKKLLLVDKVMNSLSRSVCAILV